MSVRIGDIRIYYLTSEIYCYRNRKGNLRLIYSSKSKLNTQLLCNSLIFEINEKLKAGAFYDFYL